MRAKSLKTAARDRRYARDRAEFLAEHPLCEVAWDEHCTHIGDEVHHMAGRYPSIFFRRDLWRSACHSCHQQATDNPAEAYRRGVSLRRHGIAS